MEKYLVFSEGIHEFNIEREVVDGKVNLSLFTTENGHWTQPNELLLSMVDTGDGFVLNTKIGKTLEYDMASYLKILIHVANVTDSNPKNALPFEIFEYNKISEVI